MNRASENPELHLGILRKRLLPPSDYETGFHYFLEEFGGDVKFMSSGIPEEMPQFEAVLNQIADQALGKPVKLEQACCWRVAAHRFRHGAVAVDGRALIFFYFEEVNTGLLTIIPSALPDSRHDHGGRRPQQLTRTRESPGRLPVSRKSVGKVPRSPSPGPLPKGEMSPTICPRGASPGGCADRRRGA